MGDLGNMENMEIEKKYTIKTLPDNLEQYPCKIIEQAYLNTTPVIRVRKSNEKYTLTYKGNGMMTRTEYNLPLDEPSYQHLLEKADGNIISKKRYVIPLENPCFSDGFKLDDEISLNIELDIFAPTFAPLIMAEVEFPNEQAADAFIPPAWFDEDVTLDPKYHNSNMSKQTF